jgi:hypothetical protein
VRVNRLAACAACVVIHAGCSPAPSDELPADDADARESGAVFDATAGDASGDAPGHTTVDAPADVAVDAFGDVRPTVVDGSAGDAASDANAEANAVVDAAFDRTEAPETGGAETGVEEGGATDAQPPSCPVTGTYSVPLTGTQCTTTNPGTGAPCVSVTSPFNTLAQIQLTFDSTAGWTANSLGGVIANPTPLAPTATGFAGTSTRPVGVGECSAQFTVDCQADTLSVTDQCVTALGAACATNPLSTECSPTGTIVSPPTGGISASFGQSGSASLFDAGLSDSGAVGD